MYERKEEWVQRAYKSWSEVLLLKSEEAIYEKVGFSCLQSHGADDHLPRPSFGVFALRRFQTSSRSGALSPGLSTPLKARGRIRGLSSSSKVRGTLSLTCPDR